MPVSLEFLRGLVGAISVFFAHFLGRSVALTVKGQGRKRPLFTWTLRYALSIGAVCYHGVDRLAIGVLAADPLLFALGCWDECPPHRHGDLTPPPFPDPY